MPKKTKNTRKRIIDTNIYNSSTDEPESNPFSKNRSFDLRKMEALDMLNGTNMPSKFKFRDREIERINDFIDKCIRGQKKGYKFMMITGSPGAGKTMCANFILSKKNCDIVRMNANMVKTVSEVQAIISDKLLGDDSNRTALQIIRQLQETDYDKTCIIYIEQIEMLFKTAPDIISEDFLTLFSKKNINLILLGISNTIDTLNKYSGKFSFKVNEIENVVFQPYTCENIIMIMKDKLEQILKKTYLEIQFPDKLLKFASQKLQALKKGDFRICLEFLKEITKLSFMRVKQQPQKFVITITDINDIFNKMNISKDDLMSKLPYQQQIMLIALYIIIKKTDALMITMRELQPELQWICNSLQITYSKQLMEEGLKELEQYSLVQLKKKNNQTKIILKISLSDIEATYSDHQLFKKFLNITS